PTVGWVPVALPQADDDTAMRLADLYRHRDPALAMALSQGLHLEKAASGGDMKPKPGNAAAQRRHVARGADKLTGAAPGARLAGPQARQPLRRPRPRAHHRFAFCDQGRAAKPVRSVGPRAGRERISG